MDSYESKIELKSGEQIEAKMKYGELTVKEELINAELNLYETDLEFGKIKNLTLEESKYCEIEIDEVESIELKKSYEDKIELKSINSFLANSKYIELDFKKVNEKFELDSYEGKIEIDEVGNQFSVLKLNGKYDKLYVDLGNKNVIIEANLKYGKFDFSESKYERKTYIKENDKLNATLLSKNRSEKDVTVSIEGYDSKIEIQ